MTTEDMTLAEVKAMRAELNEIKTVISNLLDQLAPYVDQLGPMIESIESSPMFKMIVGKKKKELV